MNDADEEYNSEENIEESNISIYDKPFSIDDEFIFYFKEELSNYQYIGLLFAIFAIVFMEMDTLLKLFH